MKATATDIETVLADATCRFHVETKDIRSTQLPENVERPETVTIAVLYPQDGQTLTAIYHLHDGEILFIKD